MENIKGRVDMISKVFEVLENAHKIGTRICSFKEDSTSDLKGDE